MHYEVHAVTGYLIGTAKTRDEALAIAKVYGLSEDRVFEVRMRDGWLLLAFAAVLLIVWGWFMFGAQVWKEDWPAMMARPLATLFLVFCFPAVAIIQVVKAIAEIRRSARNK